MTDRLLDVLSAAGPYAVLLVMLVVFVETGLLIGFFLPGDSLLFGAGLLVASGAVAIPVPLLMAAVAVAAFAGDQLGYTIGRRLGPRVFNRPRSRLFSPEHVGRASAFFDRHGPKAVVLARFVPVARTFVPVVAGVGRLGRTRFLTYNAIGAVLWAVTVVLAGYLLGGVPFVVRHVELCVLAVVAVSVVPMVVSHLRTRDQGGTATSYAPVAPRPPLPRPPHERS